MRIKKTIIIGLREEVFPFRTLGTEAILVKDSKEVLKTLEELVEKKDEIGLILITKDAASGVLREVEDIANRIREPIISIIPCGIKEVKPPDMRKLLMRALGFG